MIENWRRESIDEIRMLQEIIARHENLAFRVKEFFALVVAALAVAAHYWRISVPSSFFVVVAVVSYGVFSYWILYHRSVSCRAISRVGQLENRLARDEASAPTMREQGAWARETDADKSWQIVNSLSRHDFALIFSKIGDTQALIPIAVGFLITLILSVALLNDDATRYRDAPERQALQPQCCRSCDASTSGAGSSGGGFYGYDDAPCSRPLGAAAGRTESASDPQGLATTAVAALFLLVGAFLFHHFQRLAGALLMAYSAGMIFIKEVKIDKVIEKVIFEYALRQEPAVPPPQPLAQQPAPSSRFSPRKLGAVTNFAVGKFEMAAPSFDGPDWLNAKAALAEICRNWEAAAGRAGDSMVMIVGSTDRIPLKPETRLRYGASNGLGLARASAVNAYLQENCQSWNKLGDKALLLPAGPRQTPAFAPKDPRAAAGFPEDRRVEIWTLMNLVEEPPQTQKPAPARD